MWSRARYSRYISSFISWIRPTHAYGFEWTHGNFVHVQDTSGMLNADLPYILRYTLYFSVI